MVELNWTEWIETFTISNLRMPSLTKAKKNSTIHITEAFSL
jgi:hypothetical protein